MDTFSNNINYILIEISPLFRYNKKDWFKGDNSLGSHKKNHYEALSKLVLITQVGISMMTPIFLCLILGYYIDRYFGTHTIIFLIILGVGAGFRTAYNVLRKELEEAKKPDEEDREWVKKAFGNPDESEKR